MTTECVRLYRPDVVFVSRCVRCADDVRSLYIICVSCTVVDRLQISVRCWRRSTRSEHEDTYVKSRVTGSLLRGDFRGNYVHALAHNEKTSCVCRKTLLLLLLLLQMKKINMMLSRKRYRGTLQDYNKGEISKCQSKQWTNRNVLSWCLNGTREETVRRDGGGLFHARGAATGKARSPRVDLCTGGTTSVVIVDDRR